MPDLPNLNPYASPATAPAPPAEASFRARDTLAEAGRLYLANLRLIVMTVSAVWLPIHLAINYVEYEVLYDGSAGLLLPLMADLLLGVLATAAVVAIGSRTVSHQSRTFLKVMTDAAVAWPRIVWARLWTQIALLGGFVLLLVPGLYLAIRLSLTEIVAVVERTSGMEALSRSYRLTRHSFWYLVRLLGVWLLIFSAITGAVLVIYAALGFVEHWLISTALDFSYDLAGAYLTLTVFCAYRVLHQQALQERGDVEQPDQLTSSPADTAAARHFRDDAV